MSESFVVLDNFMADDLSVVNAARVSFAKRKDAVDEVDKSLINFLMRERHGTPFEHNAFRFHVKCPIFVAREWFRHRIGSFNEFSARYTQVPGEFYTPDPADVRTQVGKPGAYVFEPVDESLANETIEIMRGVNEKAYEAYLHLVSRGVAKEVARGVLPVSMMTQFYWTVNARSLMNFLSLRTHETAQLEIRRYADEVELYFKRAMPVTYDAWIKNGKVAP